MCNPKLVPGRPDLIEVNFLGGREKIDRNWYDKVMAISHADTPEIARAIARGWPDKKGTFNMKNYPRQQDLSGDTLFCLEECLIALNEVKRMTIYYSDNHLRERIHEVNQLVTQTLKKIQVPQ